MWEIKYMDEALEELLGLDKGIRAIVGKGIKKVSENPLPHTEGGFGKPLGNKRGNNLTGFFKIKYKNIGIRVVYTLDRVNKIMIVIAASARSENQCYDLANERKTQVSQDD